VGEEKNAAIVQALCEQSSILELIHKNFGDALIDGRRRWSIISFYETLDTKTKEVYPTNDCLFAVIFILTNNTKFSSARTVNGLKLVNAFNW
jgi:hypothetical protein